MVALHGFTGSGEDFEALWEHLPEGVSVAAPDLVGHGQTEAPESVERYAIGRCADDVLAISEACFGAVKPVLLGYSMGGRVALTLAARDPRRWSALVLIGATPGIEGEPERAARRAVDAERARMIRDIGVEAFADWWRQVPIIATQSRTPERYRVLMEVRRRQNSSTGLANSLLGMGTGAMPSLWGALSPLALPVWLVTGAEDEKFTGIAERMLEALPRGHHIVIPGAGHAAHLESPADTAARIGECLSRSIR